MKKVLICGNPVDGFKFIGPFEDSEEAITYQEVNDEGADWWVADLEPPEAVEPDLQLERESA